MRLKTYFLEIKYRFFFFLFTWMMNSILLFLYKEQIIYFLANSQQVLFPYFIATQLTEIFFVYCKLIIVLAFYFSFPILLLQFWFFLIPALYLYEYSLIKKFVIFSISFYFIATIVSYEIFLPYTWKFFSGFQLKGENSIVTIHLENRLADYLNFFLESFLLLNGFFHILLLGFGILQQFSLKILVVSRKIIYFIFLLIATLFTPPDVTSQLIVTLLLIISYEIFLFYVFLNFYYKRANNGI